MIKRILSIVICIFLLFSLVACGEGAFVPSQKKFDTKIKSSVLTEGEVIAKNDKYALEYAADTASVRLVEIASGTKWDICPKSAGEVQYDDFGMPIKDHVFTQSAMEVGYMDINVKGGGNYFATSLDSAVEQGRIVVKTIENGVTIEYYFDAQEFMIPVNYVLKDDYLSISIDSKKIQEGKFRITSISLAPFLNSVQNDSENSYMFIPSGSGALMNVNSYNEQGLSYKSYFYGRDYTMENKYISSDKKSLRMPIYGYKNGEKGGFTIIDNGAETAYLNAIIGSTSYNFSALYPAFQLRGYTNHETRAFKQTYFANVYPTNMIETTFSMRFYPLSGDKANYSAMANVYRDYLIAEKGLAKTAEDKTMTINLIGGTQITKSFLGVPYKTVYATTTVDQAQNIVAELSEIIKDFSVKLKGFGSTGVDVGSVGGSYTVNDNIGSDSEIKELSSICEEKNVDMYYDYDVVRFKSSDDGFSRASDSVMNSGILKAEQYVTDRANRSNIIDNSYRLLRPIKFHEAISKALNKNNKWNVKGVSLETLTSYTYSDYTEPHSTVDFNARLGYSKAASDALDLVKKGGQKLMSSDANDYAAVKSDIITDVSVTSDRGYSFYEDIPFYAMVFKGYVPMTSESVNLAISPQEIILGAIEGGVGLNYTVVNKWGNELINADYPYFFSSVYSSIKDDIIETYNEVDEYYSSIKGAKIVSNEIVNSGVHCTKFDNGVVVYVNYSDFAVSTPAGECAANSYITTGGAE